MKNTIPNFFKPLLWSFDFAKINPEKHKKTLIINAINYGDLKHWQWLNKTYGTREIRDILCKIPATALRKRVRELAKIIFNIKKFNHALRSS